MVVWVFMIVFYYYYINNFYIDDDMFYKKHWEGNSNLQEDYLLFICYFAIGFLVKIVTAPALETYEIWQWKKRINLTLKRSR